MRTGVSAGLSPFETFGLRSEFGVVEDVCDKLLLRKCICGFDGEMRSAEADSRR